MIECPLVTAISRTWHTSTSLTSIAPLLLTIYLYSASKWWYQVFKNTTLRSKNVSTTALVDVKCCVWIGKAPLGYLTWPTHCWTTSISLNWSWRSLSKVGLFMFLISPGECVQLGSLGESPHPTPLSPDFTSWLSPPGVLTQAGPPSAFVTHCSQLYCDRPHFPWLQWDIWSSRGCHLFFKEGDHSQNWDPWYAHLSAALVAAHHVMWQTKLCTHYYLKFPIKDVKKECGIGKW